MLPLTVAQAAPSGAVSLDTTTEATDLELTGTGLPPSSSLYLRVCQDFLTDGGAAVGLYRPNRLDDGPGCSGSLGDVAFATDLLAPNPTDTLTPRPVNVGADGTLQARICWYQFPSCDGLHGLFRGGDAGGMTPNNFVFTPGYVRHVWNLTEDISCYTNPFDSSCYIYGSTTPGGRAIFSVKVPVECGWRIDSVDLSASVADPTVDRYGVAAVASARIVNPCSGDTLRANADIDWGDGSPTERLPGTVGDASTTQGSHHYTRDGTFTVTLTVSHPLLGPNVTRLVDVVVPAPPPPPPPPPPDGGGGGTSCTDDADCDGLLDLPGPQKDLCPAVPSNIPDHPGWNDDDDHDGIGDGCDPIQCMISPKSHIDECALEPGDIVVARGHSGQNKIEEILGSTYWHHAGIFLGWFDLDQRDGVDPMNEDDPDREPVVADITSPPGTPATMRRFNTTQWALGVDADIVEWAAYRPNLDAGTRRRAAEAALGLLLDSGARENRDVVAADQDSQQWTATGTSYSILPTATGPEHFYCSSFVAWAYDQAGVDLTKGSDKWWQNVLYVHNLDGIFTTPDDLIENDIGATTVGWSADRNPTGGIVSVWSPAHVLVTDPLGRRAGSAPDGTVYDEIPGAVWRVTPENESVSAPGMDDSWTVTLTGYGSGEYYLVRDYLHFDGTSDPDGGGVGIPGFTRPGQVDQYSLGDVAALQGRVAAEDDAASVVAGSSVAVDVLSNDRDVDADVDPTSLRIVSGPTSGTAYVVDGKLNYLAGAVAGGDSLTYEVCDSAGHCAQAIVRLTIAASPHDPAPPVVVNDIGTTTEDVAVVVDPLANDTDPDGDLVAGSARVINAPTHGTVSAGDTSGTFRYAPAADFNGTDVFTYQVCDRGNRCAIGTITITVTAVADPPIASSDSAATRSGQSVTIDVLGNDRDPDADLNANSVKIMVKPRSGRASVVGSTGAITYTPNERFTGTDTLTYRVCDTRPVCATATVTITVASGPPRISASSISVREGDSGTKVAKVIVRLSAATNRVVTVDFRTVSVTAKAGDDYVTTADTLRFGIGETVKTIEVSVRGDRKSERDELLLVRLGGPAGATIDGVGAAGVVIVNDDGWWKP